MGRPEIKARATDEEIGAASYPSPPCAVQALMAHERLPQRVWEPACGAGVGMVLPMRETGRTVYASDLIDRGCPDSHVEDFLGTPIEAPIRRAQQGPFYAIVTNPPFSIADPFIRRALTLVPEVYMLLRLTYLEGAGRTDILERSGLRRVLVFRERLPSLHREDWDGPKVSNPTAYAWFCFRKGWRGKRAVDRISCRDIGPPLPWDAPEVKTDDPNQLQMFERPIPW